MSKQVTNNNWSACCIILFLLFPCTASAISFKVDRNQSQSVTICSIATPYLTSCAQCDCEPMSILSVDRSCNSINFFDRKSISIRQFINFSKNKGFVTNKLFVILLQSCGRRGRVITRTDWQHKGRRSRVSFLARTN